MFLFLLSASFPLLPLFIFIRFLGSGAGRRFVEEEVALFEDFVCVCRWLGSTGSRHRRVAAARLGRAVAPQSRAAAITLLLRRLLEFLFAANVASHSPFPAEFLGFNAPLLGSDLLGRRRRVEIPGRLRAVVGSSLRLARPDERAFDGGDRRGYRRSSSSGGSSGEVSGAQRVSHLEASPSIYSLSPTAAAAVFLRDVQAGSEGAGQ